jgi:hypothetical protein
VSLRFSDGGSTPPASTISDRVSGFVLTNPELKRIWCPERAFLRAEGHLAVFRVCFTATYSCARTAHIMLASAMILRGAWKNTTTAKERPGPLLVGLYIWRGLKNTQHSPQPQAREPTKTMVTREENCASSGFPWTWLGTRPISLATPPSTISDEDMVSRACRGAPLDVPLPNQYCAHGNLLAFSSGASQDCFKMDRAVGDGCPPCPSVLPGRSF